jgi:hypothetical protein
MPIDASPTPQFGFQIARVAVHSELLPREIARAPKGIVTESFGPTQIALHNARLKAPLTMGEPCLLRASTPHDFEAMNMIYLGKLTNGGLLFRALSPRLSS